MNCKTLAIIFFVAYPGTRCENLPGSFESFADALALITKAKFNFSDDVDTSTSSWIRNLKYLSCDSKVGFLVMRTKDKTYIHQNVPIGLWMRLKNAESFGAFWNANLKNKYRLAVIE